MLKKVLLFTVFVAVCFVFTDKFQLLTSTFAQNKANSAELTSVSSADFTIVLSAPTAAGVPINGRVADASGRGIARAVINLLDTDGNFYTARTNAFGYYNFREVPSGETYFADVKHKRYQFMTQVINLNEAIELNFTPMFK